MHVEASNTQTSVFLTLKSKMNFKSTFSPSSQIIKQLWPFLDEYVKTLVKDSIEPSITSCLPDYLKSFRFEKVNLGSIVSPEEVTLPHTNNVQKKEKSKR